MSWTEEKNARRWELQNKVFRKRATLNEQEELRKLENELTEHSKKAIPIESPRPEEEPQ